MLKSFSRKIKSMHYRYHDQCIRVGDVPMFSSLTLWCTLTPVAPLATTPDCELVPDFRFGFCFWRCFSSNERGLLKLNKLLLRVKMHKNHY